jgi:hypothetical protein
MIYDVDAAIKRENQKAAAKSKQYRGHNESSLTNHSNLQMEGTQAHAVPA